jgi:hypothetical protein
LGSDRINSFGAAKRRQRTNVPRTIDQSKPLRGANSTLGLAGILSPLGGSDRVLERWGKNEQIGQSCGMAIESFVRNRAIGAMEYNSRNSICGMNFNRCSAAPNPSGF